MRLAIIVLLTAALLGTARADDVAAYEVDGESAVGGSDARTAALDDAFARAARLALAELVAPNERTAKKQDLDREIVGRARLWVAKFSVVKDETNDDRRQLTVAVRVDREKMRARLEELGIAVQDGSTGNNPDGPTAPTGKARTVSILLRVADPDATRATFGPTPDKDTPGANVITGALKAGNYAPKRPTAGGSPVRPGGALPLDDTEAEGFALESKTELALVAGVTIGAPVAVRGQPKDGSLVVARVRLIDAKAHALVGEGTASVAALGDDQVSFAIERALRAALSDVLPPSPHAIAQPAGFHGDDTPIATEGVVLVRIGVKTPLSLVLAEQKYLSNAKGVQRVAIRRLSPSGWILGVVTSEGVDKVASFARKPPAKDTRVAVKVVNSIVEVTLAGSPP